MRNLAFLRLESKNQKKQNPAIKKINTSEDKEWLVYLLILITIILFTGKSNAQEKYNKKNAKLIEVCSYGVYSQDLWKIQRLIKKGADVNTTDYQGNTALHFAAKGGEAEIVEFLLSVGADVNARNLIGSESKWEETPLFRAILEGHTDVVKLLVDAGADVNSGDGYYNYPPIYYSIPHPDIVKLLLSAGADPNGDPENVENSLIYAIKRNYESFKWLIEYNANVNVRTNYGMTPLVYATRKGYPKYVKLLLKASVDVNATAKIEGREYTALSMAKEKGNESMIKLLRSYGAKEGIYSILDSIISIQTYYGFDTEHGNFVMRNGQWVPEAGTMVTGQLQLGVKLDGIFSVFIMNIIGTKTLHDRVVFRCDNGELFYLDKKQNPQPVILNTINLQTEDLEKLTNEFRNNRTKQLAWKIWKVKSQNLE